MKRLLLLALMTLIVSVSSRAERLGTMNIGGVDCTYDTLIHRHIGPGVTYTQFQFNSMDLGSSIPYKMRTHLFTVDMSNPYTQLSPYMANDTYYEYSCQDNEVAFRKNELGLKPFASTNGTGFVQVRPASDEPCQFMETMYHLVSDGLIRYDNNTPSVRYYEHENRGYIGQLTMVARVVSSKGATAAIGQINHFRDLVRGKNQLALFCNDMPRASDTHSDDGVEVFLEGGPVKVGTNRLKVVSCHPGCGAWMDKDQHVLTGVGPEMENFLKGLEPGETITIEVGYNDASGNAVIANHSYTAFISDCVKEGVAYGDPRKNVSYTAIGVSKDGNTVYLADLEISEYSNAPLRCLEDFLVNVGAWNAFYHDGGPSAEMTVDGVFVTNNEIGSGLNGRSIPNGVMLYCTAPDDHEVVSVECEDNSLRRLNVGETFRLKLFAFNKYGEMIDGEAYNNEAVTIDIPDDLGTISQTGMFTARKRGFGLITVSVKDQGVQLQIPVNIGNQKSLIFSPAKVFTCEGRPVKVDVRYFDGTEIADVDPSQVSWTVDDKYVVTSCEDGMIVPYMDGFATVTASYKDITGTVSVEVENLEAEGMESVELTGEVGSLTDMNLQLPSVPRSMYLEIQTPAATRATDAQPVTVRYTAGAHECEKVLECKDGETVIRESILFDYEAPDSYPIVLNSISPATAEVLCIKAVYTENYSAIENLYTDESARFMFSRAGKQLTLVNCAAATDLAATVYALDGTKLTEVRTFLPKNGVCLLEVNKNKPVIVRVQTRNSVQTFKLMGE